MHIKNVLFSIFVLLLFCSCRTPSNELKTDLNNLNLKGKVKSVMELGYSAIDKFGEIKKGRKFTDSDLTNFNDIGMAIDSTGFEDNIIRYKIIYEYNDNNLLVKKSNYNNNGDFNGARLYNYDEYGKILTEIVLSDESTKIDVEYNYDTISKNLESIKWHEGSHFNYSMSFYDEEERLIEHSYYDKESSSIGGRVVYEYNEDATVRTGRETHKGFEKYEGKELITSYNQNRLIAKYEVDYGKYIGMDYNPNNFRKTFEYDEFNNQVKKEIYSSREDSITITEYKYEYDEQNNWVKKIVYIDKIPKSIIVRDIEYYD